MALEQARLRVGVVIPSGNTCFEPQFNRLAPPAVSLHVARARVAGKWQRPLREMKGEIAEAAALLSDARPDVIVFHCTDTSMAQGPEGEGDILDIVREASGIEAQATSRLITEALRTLRVERLVLLTPYQNNRSLLDYLAASGIVVVADVALRLPPAEFGEVPPADWTRLARENDRPEADCIFLACANTRQIEAIPAIEAELGKPVVNSNQVVLWDAIRRLEAKGTPAAPTPQLGRLLAA